MSTAVISAPPQTATIPDYAGLNLSQLLEAWYSVKNELHELDCSYNEHFVISPVYDRQHRHLRQPLEDKLEALAKAIEPYYVAECERERQERSFDGLVGAGV